MYLYSTSFWLSFLGSRVEREEGKKMLFCRKDKRTKGTKGQGEECGRGEGRKRESFAKKPMHMYL